jgi:hypothetical protein
LYLPATALKELLVLAAHANVDYAPRCRLTDEVWFELEALLLLQGAEALHTCMVRYQRIKIAKKKIVHYIIALSTTSQMESFKQFVSRALTSNRIQPLAHSQLQSPQVFST